MTPTPEVQERLRHYLLGRLADDAREEFEKDLLTSDELYQELLIAEDELVDQYLREKLSSEERAAFEQYFVVTPERQANLRFSRAFNRYLSTDTQHKKTAPNLLPGFVARRPFLGAAALAAVVIAVIFGGLWFFRDQRSAPRTFASLTLTITQGTRAEGPRAPTVKLPLPEEALKIDLVLPDQTAPTTRYRPELQTDSGQNRVLEIVEKNTGSITVVIRTTDLTPGLYSIKLIAIGPDNREQAVNGSYLFNVQ